ncbi:MAG: DUF2905 domain-containing protein [Leptolyngbya sp. SIO1D8]|nr:DUF2905 domain-containing protein [Leptolyngbya sp. SIO1D8]
MTTVILAVILLGVLWWWLKGRSRLPGQLFKVPNRRVRSHSAGIVPNHLMRELDRLTRDRRVSERLIERVEFNHPGRSRRWCVEKAIYDIQRDRRS